LSGSDFTGARLDYVTFENCKLSKANFTGASLQHVKIIGSNFDGSLFMDANLSNARVSEGSLFQSVNFSGARMVSAWVGNSDFKGALFRSRRLDDSKLKAANLVGSVWRDVDLRVAQFVEAKMEGSIFSKIQASGLDGFVAESSLHVDFNYQTALSKSKHRELAGGYRLAEDRRQYISKHITGGGASIKEVPPVDLPVAEIFMQSVICSLGAKGAERLLVAITSQVGGCEFATDMKSYVQDSCEELLPSTSARSKNDCYSGQKK